ncbi:MAG TPA: MOSC N-terminal beta barrel domain-containing protein [Candidatus Acidoferrales bacterium]|nr:MOSC N-terminal beta barrel domain-containing protein [Candidatus Acidoferrales bacterium]
MQQIGTVAALRRYPVKSMASEDLAEARVTFAGIQGDRVYAFIDNNNKSDFPWMTGRQSREMVLLRPRFLEPPRTDENIPSAEQYAVEVLTPDGEKFRAGDDNFTRYLEQRFGRSLRVRFSECSMTDARPVSLLGLSTIRTLSDETAIGLDRRRFRENFYVDWHDPRPFFEDELVGRELQIGDTVALQVVKKNARCVMIGIDPDTAKASPQVFEHVTHKYAGCAGVYGAVLREGVVRSSDPIFLI